MFHMHRWKEVRRVLTPSVYGLQTTKVSTEFAHELSFGFTTIELRCQACGDVKTVKAVGNLAVPESK